MTPELSVGSVSTPLRVNNKVPLKMSRMYWNSRDQMHFLGLEYCKKNFSKKSFRNLKKEHLISGYSAALWLDVTASAKLSWAAKKSKQKQTACCGATHRQTETTSTFILGGLESLLMVKYKVLWPSGHSIDFDFMKRFFPKLDTELNMTKTHEFLND